MIVAFFVGNHDRASRERRRGMESGGKVKSKMKTMTPIIPPYDPRAWRAAIHNQDLIWGGLER